MKEGFAFAKASKIRNITSKETISISLIICSCLDLDKNSTILSPFSSIPSAFYVGLFDGYWQDFQLFSSTFRVLSS